MNDEPFAPFGEGPQACPFVAFEDDRDRRSDRPDYRHRCFASPQPEPRAFPHQERYCLSPEFTACPIFLEWARRESAAVVAGRRPAAAPSAAGEAAAAAGAGAAGAAAGIADAGASSMSGGAAGAAPSPMGGADEPVLPPFLSGRPRPASRQRDDEYEDQEPNPDEGLWGAEAGQSRYARRPEGAAYDRQPEGVTGTAHANASHPEWERPRTSEQYPRLSRGERRNLGRVGGGYNGGGGGRGNSFLLVALLVLVAIMAALIVVPSLLPKSGSSGPGATNRATATVKASPSSTPKPTPSPSPKTYTVKSGDTITTIAQKLGVSVNDLLAANPQIKNPDQIAIGDVLNIPGASPAPGESPSAGASGSGTPLP